MTDENKLELLAEVLDLEPEDLQPEMKLDELEEWDSVAALSFIAMMDEEFEKEVKSAEIKQFVTIQDAMDIMKA